MVRAFAVFLHKAEAPLAVRVPSAVEDTPRWTRVAILAAASFAVGVAWPHLAGVRSAAPPSRSVEGSASETPAPTPTPPVSTHPSPQAPKAATATAVATATASASALAPAPAPAPASPSSPVAVSVTSGAILGCRTAGGDSAKGADCGKVTGLDAIVRPRLRKLAECPDAASASGRLSLVLSLDFPRSTLAVDLGRGHGLAAAESLVACARGLLAGAPLPAVVHEHPRYTVAYGVTFGPGGRAAAASPSVAAAPAPEPARTTAAETAQITYDAGLVRDAPSRSGKILVRLPRGTTVRLGELKDGWYTVRYGEGYGAAGWLYRGAVGR